MAYESFLVPVRLARQQTTASTEPFGNKSPPRHLLRSCTSNSFSVAPSNLGSDRPLLASRRTAVVGYPRRRLSLTTALPIYPVLPTTAIFSPVQDSPGSAEDDLDLSVASPKKKFMERAEDGDDNDDDDEQLDDDDEQRLRRAIDRRRVGGGRRISSAVRRLPLQQYLCPLSIRSAEAEPWRGQWHWRRQQQLQQFHSWSSSSSSDSGNHQQQHQQRQ
mmetsp:Transcript_11711/g.33363  ORF Transcript_11711/g.33363 Transcript_11711/m.33363 type:complete len:218 (+) Transcript_11711:394-1047(+)